MWILDTIFAREILLVWMFCPQLTDTMSQILDKGVLDEYEQVYISPGDTNVRIGCGLISGWGVDSTQWMSA